MTAPIVDLEQLAAVRCAVLKDEPSARVELLGEGHDAVVRKTYVNRGLRLLQTFLRRARAAREHDNLAAVERAGVPCTPALGWSERRRWGFVLASTLVTGHVADAATLKSALAGLAGDHGNRARLCRALGALLASLHREGILWCTPMPRNVLLVGEPATARLVVCDVPAAVRFPGPVPEAAALLDLFDAAGSPSRRRELSAAERWRCVLAYAAGDRARARSLWRRLLRRSVAGHRLRKNLTMALRTYILRRPAPAVPATR